MSESSSDEESSSGWTIITNEGSDIETLGSEAVAESRAEQLSRPPVEEAELHVNKAPVSSAEGTGERGVDSLDDTLAEQTAAEPLCILEDGDKAPEGENGTPLSLSDHSDIVTLAYLREDEHADVEDEAAADEELYLGTSSSSQYSFSAPEKVLPLREQPSDVDSSSSENEAGQSPTAAPRRRRVRRNTTGTVTEEEAALESSTNEEAEEKVKYGKQQEDKRGAALDNGRQDRCRRILNTCVMLALVVAVCMGFCRFFGTNEVPEELFVCGGADMEIEYDLEDEEPFTAQIQMKDLDLEAKDHNKIEISLLSEMVTKIKKEKQDLKQQLQRNYLEQQEYHNEKDKVVAKQRRLTAENQQLERSLEGEKRSYSSLMQEVTILKSEIEVLEARGSEVDSLLSENQRLKEQLEEEKQVTQNLHGEKEGMAAEAQTLQKKLDKERKVTGELRRELSGRLMELERKLRYEQQRSDLWERLYVETKEERAKGDTDSTVKKPKKGMAGKVKETFDAVKNSTKEFVHHHKEQIKKAKESVKENLRKFSDSVKSTFRHFKDSASTLFNKVRGYCKGCGPKNAKESWQHRAHKSHHRHTHKNGDSFQSHHGTRKSGKKVPEDQGQSGQKVNQKGCTGVFECAYQESMSLFNRGMDPVRADEFNQLLQSYVQQEVHHFHHWKELEMFINNFFHNGVFIHDQKLFTDFVSDVQNYLAELLEYHGLHDDMFGDLDNYIYRHFFGEAHTKNFSPKGPFEGPSMDPKEQQGPKHQQRRQQKAKSRSHSERKCSASGKNSDRHMADVKIELGPMPFDPKY